MTELIEVIHVRASTHLVEKLDQEAVRLMLSRSAYIRQTLGKSVGLVQDPADNRNGALPHDSRARRTGS